MKNLLLILAICVLCFSCGDLFAADKGIQWNQSAGADGYKASISVDLGVTWTELPVLVYESITYTSTTAPEIKVAKATITVPDGVLVLIRVGAYNSVGTTWSLESGAFYNNSWELPPTSKGLGIKVPIRSFCAATVFTIVFIVIVLSAESTALSYRKSISC